MRSHAANAGQRRRSSPTADAVALVCAAGLLLVAIWTRGPQFLHAGSRFYAALLTTLAFAVAARLARGVNNSGALAGGVIAFIFAGRDLRMFWLLLMVFFITLAATRVGHSRKQLLRLAEAESGRSASQVMANLGIAGLMLAIPSLGPAVLIAIAALAEVTADTTSSEIGLTLSANTVLITTWKPVPSGTDGGISLVGTAAGLFSTIITAGCAFALGLVSLSAAAVIACAGAAGMLVDSFLGALLERRGYLNNDLVNLLSTAAAAGIAWTLRTTFGSQ